MNSTRVLEVSGLAKRFTMHLRGSVSLSVLDDVTLAVDAGECVALVGPSGRGKSTLMKCLYGNYAIAEGRALLAVDGDVLDIAEASPQRILALRRRHLAYVSQFLRAVPRVSALDLVAQRVLEADDATQAAGGEILEDARYDTHLERARDEARALFTRLALPPTLWDLPPATFSGGEQQRVNIARGFVVPSRLLLLDEPTASLDRENRDRVVTLIREAKARGTAIVGIFHDETVRDAVADRTFAFV